jgi:hypothetical protein
MKCLLAIVGILALAACTLPPQYYLAGDSGNPNHSPYAGSVGSSYDSNANPPLSGAPVAYNPNAPSTSPNNTIPPTTPAPTMPAR